MRLVIAKKGEPGNKKEKWYCDSPKTISENLMQKVGEMSEKVGGELVLIGGGIMNCNDEKNCEKRE